MRGKPNNGRHPNFKTGIIKAHHKYVLVFVGKHHHLADCRGYAYEHRINAEKKIGRRLKKGEFVHHIDEVKWNNDPDNLKVYPSRAHHFEQHRKINNGKKLPDEVNATIRCGCGCGIELRKFDNSNRPRKYIRGHNIKHKYGN